MKGYFITVYVGDYTARIWVCGDNNAPYADRLKREKAAIRAAFKRAIEGYR